MSTLEPRVVVVTRRSAYRELLDRHGTPGAVAFFLRDRDPDELDVLRSRHDAWAAALDTVQAALPRSWRTGRADREELAAFPFGDGDIVVAVGPDGLVANVAKYLDGQPVIGVDPQEPAVLARHRPEDVAAVLRAVVAGTAAVQDRQMVVAELDDGQHMRGLNEVFVGDRGHQSARYLLRLPDGRGEPQSSSGVVVGTGTGATGWCASLVRGVAAPPRLPDPAEQALCWFVREAWPSPTTGAELVAGRLEQGERLELTVGSDSLVVFSDGGEADRLTAVRGQRVTIGLDEQRLRLVG
ncbi:hypothetical protein [Pseudonocardia sp. TRM90224]|uniref:hypothetical protein n=1 Tax=Pseudonocardia sp. TRM90224 TaxID=2812678 RepID=UPI001E2A00AC|nr:hypothetical protein [Pseudonocardia sp. TRM90224]